MAVRLRRLPPLRQSNLHRRFHPSAGMPSLRLGLSPSSGGVGRLRSGCVDCRKSHRLVGAAGTTVTATAGHLRRLDLLKY